MELLNYWPELMAALGEFQALAEVEQPEISASIAAVRTAPDDFFIETLGESGAQRWERMLKLPVQNGGVLADRRFRIMTRAAEQRPFTARRLEELLGTLCGTDGFSVALAGSAFTLTVRVALTAKQNYDDVKSLLGRVVPANMVIDLSLLYNQHQTLAALLHSRLANYSHDQLRNEVLTSGNEYHKL